MEINLSAPVQLRADPQEADLFQLAEQLGSLLLARSWRVSCAESCTGGGIAYAITSVAGSSAWFDKSWVTYANEAKQNEINVDEDVLQNFGAVSAQTAEQMVTGVKVNSGAQVAVSVTGIAGPGGGSAEKPVGLVWFGFDVNGTQQVVSQQFLGDRGQVRRQAIAFALANLIEQLVA
ncbi:CinA family protein [Alteromonas sp. ASW11-36]|uniref:CinA family protein n=1 Tax=Alteromonas arenosi TaxID=3055817 RepID=A0ABT7T0J3_9ALTE|nr:CinA family protein [Alteromonas sp. ASW11-36]MDM7861952.1 CinA family protein [Alteromonas sp. ASW11-36]